MTNDDPTRFPAPTRKEPRGEFPPHSDRLRFNRTAAEAKREAADRLADWEARGGADEWPGNAPFPFLRGR